METAAYTHAMLDRTIRCQIDKLSYGPPTLTARSPISLIETGSGRTSMNPRRQSDYRAPTSTAKVGECLRHLARYPTPLVIHPRATRYTILQATVVSRWEHDFRSRYQRIRAATSAFILPRDLACGVHRLSIAVVSH